MQNGRIRKVVALLKLNKSRNIPAGIQPIVSEASLLQRNQKNARLYEQGAPKKRIDAYLQRWLGGLGTPRQIHILCVGLVCVSLVTGCATHGLYESTKELYPMKYDAKVLISRKLGVGGSYYSEEADRISKCVQTGPARPECGVLVRIVGKQPGSFMAYEYKSGKTSIHYIVSVAIRNNSVVDGYEWYDYPEGVVDIDLLPGKVYGFIVRFDGLNLNVGMEVLSDYNENTMKTLGYKLHIEEYGFWQ